MEEHYELYKGYIAKTNEIQKKLDTVDRATANQIYSDLRALRVDLSFAIGGVKNHELYFAHLGGKRRLAGAKLTERISRDFPSYDAWLADFKASGLAARGWVWLAYDHDLEILTTVVGDRRTRSRSGTRRRSWRWTSTSTRTGSTTDARAPSTSKHSSTISTGAWWSAISRGARHGGRHK
jgi:superoxide dismutase